MAKLLNKLDQVTKFHDIFKEGLGYPDSQGHGAPCPFVLKMNLTDLTGPLLLG